MSTALSSGVSDLDRRLDGGLQEGSLISLVAPPASQVSPIFYSLIQERPTVYFTTYRRKDVVRNELENSVRNSSNVTIVDIGVDQPVEQMYRALEQLDTDRSVNLIVDPMNPIEDLGDRSNFVDLLNDIKEYALRTDSLAFLYCADADTTPQWREITLTYTDSVWELEVTADEDTIETHLLMPKDRCNKAVAEVVKLDLGRSVVVDNSRDI